jgi:hypothetical protein
MYARTQSKFEISLEDFPSRVRTLVRVFIGSAFAIFQELIAQLKERILLKISILKLKVS